jgi:suppressor of G2 allele of SKP1
MAGSITVFAWGRSFETLDRPICLPTKTLSKAPRPSLPIPAELAMDSAAKGDKASAASNYPLAIEHFTNALTEMPRAPGYFISRSTAYSRLKADNGGPNFEAALNDAEVAVRLAFERGNRELLISAQMRRAVSLYQLGRFGDASYLFELLETKLGTTKPSEDKKEDVQAAMKRSEAGPKTNYGTQLPIWLTKIRSQMNKKTEGDDKWAVNIKEIPESVDIPAVPELKAQLAAVKAGNVEALARVKAAVPPAKEASAVDSKEKEVESTPPPIDIAAHNFRHEWYQTNENVFVTLYVKNLTHHVFTINFTETSVRVSLEFLGSKLTTSQVLIRLPLPSGDTFDFALGPFWGTVIADKCTHVFKPNKIEIKMPKKVARKWHALEGKTAVDAGVRDTTGCQSAPSVPSYPTSSRSGPKDWDKLASSLTGKSAKKSEGTKQRDDDDVSEDEFGGDAVDGFFKKLYAGADPETRRAMIKSYTESQGTSLSTNWSEVAKGKVEAVESDSQ